MSSVPIERDNSFSTCMSRVKQKRQKVSINPGFVHQLRVWEAHLNRNKDGPLRGSPEYRHWKKAREMGVVAGTRTALNTHSFSVMGMPEDRIKASVYLRHSTPRQPTFVINPSDFHDFPTINSLDPDLHRYPPWTHLLVPKEYYRCSQCLIPLVPKDYAFHLSNPSDNFHGESCTHVFLCKAMSWMDGQIDHSSPGGKLFCNQCEQQVGEYCWMGSRCACGELCAPGVALKRSMGIDGEWCGWELYIVEDVEEDVRNQRSSALLPATQNSRRGQGRHAGEGNQSERQAGEQSGAEEGQNFVRIQLATAIQISNNGWIWVWVHLNWTPSRSSLRLNTIRLRMKD